MEAAAQVSPQSDSLAVGSSSGSEHTCQTRSEFLLSIDRSHPTQVKHSRIHVPTFQWTDLNQDSIDWLKDLVPNASLFFNLESLTGRHQKFNGRLGSWIELMNDRSISARKVIDEVIHNNWRPITPSPFGGRWRGGPWRLLSSLADYAEPWKPLTWNDLCSEFPTSRSRIKITSTICVDATRAKSH